MQFTGKDKNDCKVWRETKHTVLNFLMRQLKKHKTKAHLLTWLQSHKLIFIITNNESNFEVTNDSNVMTERVHVKVIHTQTVFTF